MNVLIQMLQKMRKKGIKGKNRFKLTLRNFNHVVLGRCTIWKKEQRINSNESHSHAFFWIDLKFLTRKQSIKFVNKSTAWERKVWIFKFCREKKVFDEETLDKNFNIFQKCKQNINKKFAYLSLKQIES